MNKKIVLAETKQQGVVKATKVTWSILETVFEDAAIVRCSKNDTYDFEVGALIALMRTCGMEKVEKALNEVFPDNFMSQSKIDNDYQEAIKAFRGLYLDETRTISNRDKLWTEYLSNDGVCIKVRCENINEFLKEAELNGILWWSGPKPTERTYWDEWRKSKHICFFIEKSKTRNDVKRMTYSAESIVRTHDYTPPLNAKLFKRGKYAIRVKKENYADFRKWCKINDIKNEYASTNATVELRYSKIPKEIRLNDIKYGPVIPIVYNWDGMITPDVIKGITIRYKEYTPPLNAKLFKRGKYAIRVKKENYADFRKWCKINDIKNEYASTNATVELRYSKIPKEIRLNDIKYGPVIPIVYNWDGMITPDVIKGITIRYKEESHDADDNF